MASGWASWDANFEWVRTLDLPDDFMGERQQPEDDMRDLLTAQRRSVAEFP